MLFSFEEFSRMLRRKPGKCSFAVGDVVFYRAGLYRTAKKIIVMLFALLSISALAQSEKACFTADRPGTTTGVDVLPKGRVQWETGMAYERVRLGDLTSTTWTLNSSLFRWGFSQLAELRLQADYLYNTFEGDHHHGFSNVAIGTKARLFEGWQAVPAISLLGNVFIPGSREAAFMLSDWSGQMGLLFQNEITPWLSLGYETDIYWYSQAKPTFFWGFCLTFQATKRCSLMVEEFNNQYYGLHDNWLELGAAFQIAPRLQLDISTDISLNYPKDYFNLMLGVAWQINKK